MASGISDESVLRKLLQHMNSQVPAKRPLLSELEEQQDPHYVARDGTRYELSNAELAVIGEVLRKSGLRDIRLPIILVADSSQSQSVWRVDGEPECAVISHALGRDFTDQKSKLFLYAAHMSVIRRTLPTTTTCMFIP